MGTISNWIVAWWILAAILIVIENQVSDNGFFIGNIWELLTFFGGLAAALFKTVQWWVRRQRDANLIEKLTFPPKGTKSGWSSHTETLKITTETKRFLVAARFGGEVNLEEANLRFLRADGQNDSSPNKPLIVRVRDHDAALRSERGMAIAREARSSDAYHSAPDDAGGCDFTFIFPGLRIAKGGTMVMDVEVKPNGIWSGLLSFQVMDRKGELRRKHAQAFVKWQSVLDSEAGSPQAAQSVSPGK